jgi:nicotinamide-nucleotide amidase
VQDLEQLGRSVGQALKRQGLMLATAESCTGGWIAQTVTAVAGSSAWFDRGFVTYSNRAKHELLQVPLATLEQFGAVSEATARAMAEGALRASHADVTLAVTGIAGPAGGSAEKPVGTVWFAWAGKRHVTLARMHHFDGDRAAVRRQAVATALNGLIEFLG